MKKTILALFAIALFVSCQKENHGDANLHLTGNIKGLRQGKLYIQKVVDTSLVAIDTIVINGKSTFESWIKVDSPQMLYLFLDRGQTNSVDNNLPFFAEPGEMKIETANDEFFYRAKITGSKNQKLFEDYKKIMTRYKDAQLSLTEEKLRAFQFKREAATDIEKRDADNLKRRYLFSINFALNNKDSEIAPYIALAEIYDANIKYLDTIHNSLTPKVTASKYGKMLTQFIDERKKLENQ